jgi:uncharacterized protein (TIGR03435 family)
MTRHAGIAAFVLSASLGAQQPAPGNLAFEAASIKANASGDFRMSFAFQPGGRLVAVNVPVVMILLQAYRIPDYRIVGIPAWARSTRFDINAKGLDDLSPEAMQQMTRSLLAERFHMAAHIETREEDGLALVLARRDGRLGPELRKSATDCAARSAAQRRGESLPPPPPAANGAPVCSARPAIGALTSGAMTMELLAMSLSLAISQPVVDKTGLAGDYEVALRYTPERPGRGGTDGAAPPSDDNVSIFTAVREQLGLKLEPRRGPQEFLIIDRLERPTED